MYEQYWRLNTKPFEDAADESFFFRCESQQGALLKLRYAIENRRGAALLAGAAGLGKTCLARALANQLPETHAPRVHVVFPQMPPDQLLAYLTEKLTGESAQATPTIDNSVRRLETTLADNTAAGRHALIIVDEAHLLEDWRTLETLRLLMNFECQSQPTLTLLLAGQPSLLSIFDRAPEFDERLAVKCLLRRFSPQESIAYINHRLTAAGAQQAVFDESALQAIHALANGAPRRINRLCDLALLIGFAEERPAISSAQIEAVAEELTVAAPQ